LFSEEGEQQAQHQQRKQPNTNKLRSVVDASHSDCGDTNNNNQRVETDDVGITEQDSGDDSADNGSDDKDVSESESEDEDEDNNEDEDKDNESDSECEADVLNTQAHSSKQNNRNNKSQKQGIFRPGTKTASSIQLNKNSISSRPAHVAQKQQQQHRQQHNDKKRTGHNAGGLAKKARGHS
jgi:hypothetical protein